MHYLKRINQSIVIIILLITTSLFFIACNTAKQATSNASIIIKEQGSFAIGGSVIKNQGIFNANKPTAEGQTFHGDHAYAFYQIPVNARKYPLVFLHGAGSSKNTWETTPDGREGFQNIFLRKNFSVYLLDQPRRGEAGRSAVAATITPTPDEQFWFTQFRFGVYPDYFPNVQFPKDSFSMEQLFRKGTPNTGSFDENVVSDAVSSLFTKIGEGILITHSQGGGPGWLTAIKNKNVKAVIACEPWSGFVFPEGELPAPIKSTGQFGELKGAVIPLEDFKKLTQIPIVIYYGDNIAKEPTTVWNKDHWRAGLEMARIWAATINKYGGDATVIYLPEIGINGNTHFLMSDVNNVEIANQLYEFLKKKGLN
jgi:pimeloyl-ACP methyl ester carboxylesterase